MLDHNEIHQSDFSNSFLFYTLDFIPNFIHVKKQNKRITDIYLIDINSMAGLFYA